jgi:WD40 repeat protein
MKAPKRQLVVMILLPLLVPALVIALVKARMGWEQHQKDVEAQRTEWVLKSQAWVSALAFSPDEEILAAGEGSQYATLLLWRWKSSTVLHGMKTGHMNAIAEVVFSADGRTVTTSGSEDGLLKTWNVSSGGLIGARTPQPTKSRRLHLRRALSRDKKYVATASSGKVVVRTVSGGKTVSIFETKESSIEAMAFSPSNRWLAASGRGKVYVWKLPPQ